MPREFKLATYVIRNASTPTFATPDGAFVAPNSSFVAKLAKVEDTAGTPIFTISGDIRKDKDNSDLVIKTLKVSAEKYTHAAFSYSDNEDGSVVTITLPDFKRGAGIKVRKYDATAKTVAGLRGLRAIAAPVAAVATVESNSAPKAE